MHYGRSAGRSVGRLQLPRTVREVEDKERAVESLLHGFAEWDKNRERTRSPRGHRTLSTSHLLFLAKKQKKKILKENYTFFN